MEEKLKLIEFLKEFVTPHKIDIFDSIVLNRTRYITVLLEDIYQSQNASAVLRTADCFGMQDVHIIENKNQYKINPDVALGSYQWLTLHKYSKKKNNTLEAIKNLKKQGYRIVATTPHINDTNLQDFDLTKGKTAILLGSELKGLSQEALNNADEYLKIPMYGFTESFNISVSASIILHHLSLQLHQSKINWQLSDNEKADIQINWLKKSIKKSSLLVNKFYENQQKTKL